MFFPELSCDLMVHEITIEQGKDFYIGRTCFALLTGTDVQRY